MAYMARPSLGGRGAMGGGGGSAASAAVAAAAAAAKKRAADTFCFPVLRVEEICACLSEMGIHVEVEDVEKAKADVIRNVYEQLIVDCLGLTKDELYQAKVVDGYMLKFEELHDESVPVVHFIRAMQKLLLASGVSDGFTLRDLMRPDPSRVRRNLSGIINFQKYREDKRGLYRSYEARNAALVDAKMALERERAELMEQLAHEKEVRAAEQPHVDTLTAEVARLTREQDALDGTIARLRSGVEEQKSTLEHMRNEIKLTDIKIEGAKEDLEAKRSQIVASPARLRSEMEAAGRAVEEARAAVARGEAERVVLRRRAEIVAKADKDLTKATTLMAEVEAEIAKLKKVAREMKAKQAEAENEKTEVSMLETQVKHLERGLHRADERCTETKQAKVVKEEAASRAVRTLRTELTSLHDDIGRAREERRSAEVRRGELEADRELATKRHNAEMADMLAVMKSVQRSVADYHARLFRALGDTAGGSGGGGGGGGGGSTTFASLLHGTPATLAVGM